MQNIADRILTQPTRNGKLPGTAIFLPRSYQASQPLPDFLACHNSQILLLYAGPWVASRPLVDNIPSYLVMYPISCAERSQLACLNNDSLGGHVAKGAADSDVAPRHFIGPGNQNARISQRGRAQTPPDCKGQERRARATCQARQGPLRQHRKTRWASHLATGFGKSKVLDAQRGPGSGTLTIWNRAIARPPAIGLRSARISHPTEWLNDNHLITA